MDNYTEQLLDCKPSSKSNALFGAGIALIILGAFMVIMISLVVGVIFIAVGAFVFSYGRNGQNSEFEYLFINGDLEIARINNKENRKNEFTMSEGDVQRILPYESPKGKNELEVNKKLTILDFTSGNEERSKNWYIFLVNRKNGTDAAILELNGKNIEHCKNVFKQKFEV